MTQSKSQHFTYFKSFEQADVWDESFFHYLDYIFVWDENQMAAFWKSSSPFQSLCQLSVWSGLWYKALEIRGGICRPCCLKLNGVKRNSQKSGLGGGKKQTPKLRFSQLEDNGVIFRQERATWCMWSCWRKTGLYRNYMELVSMVNCICCMVFANPNTCNARLWNLGGAKFSF